MTEQAILGSGSLMKPSSFSCIELKNALIAAAIIQAGFHTMRSTGGSYNHQQYVALLAL